jgi:hypothetical protein
MRLTFIIGAVLATFGTALSVYGIQQAEGKLFGEGFMLLFGGGVFAILSLGGRRARGTP